MKVCVLQPDYSASHTDYKDYDPARDLTDLLPGHEVDHVAVHKLTAWRQLKHLATQGYDIFINLCEGYPDWDVPGIDVIDTLERLGLPFTGPSSTIFDPPKPLMKYVAYAAGVRTPLHAVVATDADLPALAGLRYPLFVKPAHAGDSLGIDEHSVVGDREQLDRRVAAIRRDYGEALVEEYIAGREFTVLVLASAEEEGAAIALRPVEFLFPPGTHFKTYALKTSDLHPEANVPVQDDLLAARLKDAALRIFTTFGGVGYARLDFRLGADGELYFLEINFSCSVFYSDGYEGSADHVLRHDGLGQAGFAAHIIAEGIARHRRTVRPYAMRGNAIAGYGIFATRAIAAGEVVWRGEERPHRLVTRAHVDASWSDEHRRLLRRYGYPVADGVYAFWSANPAEWAPQNHSCSPNTAMDGLNLVALRDVADGEELTLDYADLLDADSESFDCHCGAPGCRGRVSGTPGNSVAARAMPVGALHPLARGRTGS
jgi:D-alanine-D-alanine ligase-like ATP-grasp enzyme